MRADVKGTDYSIGHGDVVIAAITSCTNTSNPSVLIAAGLVARNARKRGLKSQPWVKTSLAPGSQVVTDYLAKAGLQDDLDALGFNLVGYGCTTCIGNSGPLPEAISAAVTAGRSRRLFGALGQPQLRRPREPRRAGELSRLAAAGGRLRPRRLDECRRDEGRRSGTTRTTNPSISRTSGRPPRRSPIRCARR